jgi:WD40 repeat protein
MGRKNRKLVATIHVNLQKYPMVSFHQESQRLAVGTNENVIIIYDLKTATRWHVLEGHKNSVSAVAFNDNGKALSSYSIMETSVRIWQTGTSFFGILGSQPQCVKNFSVSKPTSMCFLYFLFVLIVS